MARRRKGDGVRTQAPREATLLIAVFLWLVGFADVILGAFTLPNNLGVWALLISGLLLIIGSVVEGI